MNDKIQIDGNVPQLDGHVVPCQIHYTGEAKTSDYFTPSKYMDRHNHHISYFRGCKFEGKKIDMTNYDGYVINKSESLAPGDDGDDYKIINTFNAVAKFNDLIVYGQDRLPPPTSQYMLMQEWQDISKAIHDDD